MDDPRRLIDPSASVSVRIDHEEQRVTQDRLDRREWFLARPRHPTKNPTPL